MSGIDWRIPPSVTRWMAEAPACGPVAVLLRHSVRDRLQPGEIGYALPITPAGAALGHELGTLLGSRLRTLHTSPLARCVQTAEAVRAGATDRAGATADIPIVRDRLLGDPGVYVVDEDRAWSNWVERGHESVMEHLVSQDHPLPGMADPASAARLLVQHMLARAGGRPGLHVFVTHDSLVTTTAARLLGEPLGKNDWPWYLEGAFFWRQDDHLITAYRDRRNENDTLKRDPLTGFGFRRRRLRSLGRPGRPEQETKMDVRSFVRGLPKAELHLHLEGSLEPDMLMRLAARNKVGIPFRSVEEIRAAYRFTELQDFLDVYYQGMNVLREEEDFYDLTMAYLQRAATDGAVHVEVFYDPQGHTARGIPFPTVTDGILAALADGRERLGITSLLILCILRHLPEDEGFATFRQAEPYVAGRRIAGLGLDSTEKDNPPARFRRLFAAAREAGLKLVAHAGEEGPAAYVADTVDLLKVDRIDHGNRALEDPALVRRLAASGIPLTVCPLSNLRLRGVTDLRRHPLKRMLDAGLKATVNSDDPSYFGGYLLDNFVAIAEALGLGRPDLVTLARNSIEGSFLDEPAKEAHLARIDRVVAATG